MTKEQSEERVKDHYGQAILIGAVSTFLYVGLSEIISSSHNIWIAMLVFFGAFYLRRVNYWKILKANAKVSYAIGKDMRNKNA